MVGVSEQKTHAIRLIRGGNRKILPPCAPVNERHERKELNAVCTEVRDLPAVDRETWSE